VYSHLEYIFFIDGGGGGLCDMFIAEHRGVHHFYLYFIKYRLYHKMF
jgi:hypothetical protein